MPDRPTVFISYSHKDEEWKDRLHPHLKALVLEGVIELWDDRKIDTGDEWYPEIQAAMARANAAICLISENYLSSDFIIKEEVPYLLTKRRDEGMFFYPVLISPCPWKRISWLKGIQMYPTDGRCIEGIKDLVEQKTAFSDIALELWEKVSSKIAHAEEVATIEAAPVEVQILGIPREIEESILPEKEPVIVDIDRLPVTGKDLFGRQKELDLLDDAWVSGKTNVTSFVAWGGVGKSTLVNRWLEFMKAENYKGASRVYGWSFYSQGTGDKVTSADQFIAAALEWFGDPNSKIGSPWDKGQRLAELVKRKKTLLILDGLEPLQSYMTFEKGKIKDPALSVLITELARENTGLCVITTRDRIADVEELKDSVQQIDLDIISKEAGRALLRAGGVRGTDAELEKTAGEFGHSALALTLLASYIYEIPGHHIAKAASVPDLDVSDEKGRHARRVIATFAERFGDSLELDMLKTLGLFDRPAEEKAVKAIRAEPIIRGLTQHRFKGKTKWPHIIEKLRDLRLIARKSHHNPTSVDCHPIIREHFGALLKETYVEAWKEGHKRLCQYYKKIAPKYPETLEKMMPLYAAVAHGCEAGQHFTALIDVYSERISRRDIAFSVNHLGAFGIDLSCLSHFFEKPWTKPVQDIPNSFKAALFGWVGFRLRALGRLSEAVEPMETGLEMRITQEDWKNAAIAAGNLSELLLINGNIIRSVEYAKKSVDWADKSHDTFWKIAMRTILANALHHAGMLEKASIIFGEAEETQKKMTPQYFYLYSVGGFNYCDFLLERGKYEDVLERIRKTFEWAREAAAISLLDMATMYLSQGRALLMKAIIEQTNDLADAERELSKAVDAFRQSNSDDQISRGLLSRSEFYRHKKDFGRANHDIDEAFSIAKRGEMRLYEADCHLAYARLYLAEGNKEKEKEHLAIAKKMIEEMGYHRRDKDVREMEGLLEEKHGAN